MRRRQPIGTLGSAGESLLSCALVLLAAGRLGAQRTIINEKGLGILDRAVLIEPANFNTGSVERLARSFLQENRGQKILRLTVATDEGALLRCFSSRSRPDLEAAIAEMTRVRPTAAPLAR